MIFPWHLYKRSNDKKNLFDYNRHAQYWNIDHELFIHPKIQYPYELLNQDGCVLLPSTFQFQLLLTEMPCDLIVAHLVLHCSLRPLGCLVRGCTWISPPCC